MKPLETSDPELAWIIKEETKRQNNELNLIASENFVDEAMLETVGSVLTNKYAEGYPGRRHYAGCKWVDKAEELGINRAKELFGAEYANLQPHSGSQANMAAYLALLKPGDKILGMALSAGGHLTHGTPFNFSGKLYKTISYGLDKKTNLIDYGQVGELAYKYRPKLIIAGASAYPRSIDFSAFHRIAKEVGAYFMVDMAHTAGLVAGGQLPNPVPYADVVTLTTQKTLGGPRGGIILCKEKYANSIDRALFPGIQGGPLMHVIAAKALALGRAMKPGFKKYSKQVIKNAQALAGELSRLGYSLVTGGTDTHMVLINLLDKDISGQEAEETLQKAGIVVNKNKTPFDKDQTNATSGIRVGTPPLTTRGMREEHMRIVARFIETALSNIGNETRLKKLKEEVSQLCEMFPIYR